jgi:hypothetical protein
MPRLRPASRERTRSELAWQELSRQELSQPELSQQEPAWRQWQAAWLVPERLAPLATARPAALPVAKPPVAEPAGSARAPERKPGRCTARRQSWLEPLSD